MNAKQCTRSNKPFARIDLELSVLNMHETVTSLGFNTLYWYIER